MRTLPSGLVTFMFTDIEGSTPLHRQLAERFVALIAEHDGLLSRVIDRNGGVVVKSLGDGIFAAFDDPSAAMTAAAEIQEVVADHQWPDLVPLRVRIGLHAGIAQPQGRDYVAIAAHQASRVMAAAHGGQVLLTEAVAEHDRQRCTALGLFDLRDFDDPAELYALRGVPFATAESAPRTLRAGRQSFPAFRTTFIGRERELATLRKAVVEWRLVSLVGPGGAGKTRTAVQAAADLNSFAAAWFVDLSSVSHGREIGLAVRTALTDVEGHEDLVPALAALLGDRPALLLLDNCEQVIDEAAAAADELLAGCPSLHVLVTSREPLQLPDERVISLLGLGLPDAANVTELRHSEAGALFLDRLAMSSDAAVEDSTAAVVAEVVSALDGLPLALELVAAMAARMSVEELHELVRGPLYSGEVGRARGRPARQATLTAVVDWSLEHLDDMLADALVALAHASTPIAGRTARAALVSARIAESRVPDLVQELAGRSLVVDDASNDGLRLLNTIQARCLALPRAGQLRTRVVAGLAADCLAALDPAMVTAAFLESKGPTVAPTAGKLLDDATLPGLTRQRLALGLHAWYTHHLGGRRAAERSEWAITLGDYDTEVTAFLHANAAAGRLYSGEHDRAAEHLAAARRLEPRTHDVRFCLLSGEASLHLYGGRFAEVRQLARRELDMTDAELDRVRWLQVLARADALAGDHAGAEPVLAELAGSVFPVRILARLELANSQALQGKTVDALRNSLRYVEQAVLGPWESHAVAEVIATAIAAERLTVEALAIVRCASRLLPTFGRVPYEPELAAWEELDRRAEAELTPEERKAADELAATLDPTSALELALRLARVRIGRGGAGS